MSWDLIVTGWSDCCQSSGRIIQVLKHGAEAGLKLGGEITVRSRGPSLQRRNVDNVQLAGPQIKPAVDLWVQSVFRSIVAKAPLGQNEAHDNLAPTPGT